MSRALVMAASLLLATTSGCLDGLAGPVPSGSSAELGDASPASARIAPLGLGIDVPPELPPAGPFREDRQHLATLERFLTDEGGRMLGRCGHPDGSRTVKAELEDERHLFAVEGLISACSRPTQELDQFYADNAIRDGNEEHVRDDLHARAVSALANLTKRLDEHPGPGNAVEAQLLYALMVLHQFNRASIETAMLLWIPYEDGSRRDNLQLRNVYLNLLGPRAESEIMVELLDRYPWSGLTCSKPDMVALGDRVASTLSKAAASAEANAEDSDKKRRFWYGKLFNATIPNFEFYREHGWWLGMLAVEVKAEADLVYWDNRTYAPAWPTMEEAKFLLAQKRNESRTLWHEEMLSQYLFLFEDEFMQSLHPWATFLEDGPPAFMADVATRWPYDGLVCPPSP